MRLTTTTNLKHLLIRGQSNYSTSTTMSPPSSIPNLVKKSVNEGISKGDAITKPSLSASLILIAPLSTKSEDGYDYRVLLLKRNSASSTFQSASVFPGGNLDPVDTSTSFNSFFPENSNLSIEESKQRSLEICAVRETFEECGILLMEGNEAGEKVWEGISPKERLEWRDKVHSNGKAFVDLFNLISTKSGTSINSTPTSRPALSSLTYRANWVTPRNMKRRFDTHFFITILPSQPQSFSTNTTSPILSEPIASADGKETTSADWLTPSEAMKRTMLHTKALTLGLDQAEEGSLILFPPQYYLLAELSSYKSWKDLIDSTSFDSLGRNKVKSRPVESFEPEMRKVLTDSGEKRAATVLPGDPEHSATSKLGSIVDKDARHRTYILLPSEKGIKKLGLTVQGCLRRGLEGWLGDDWGAMEEGDTGNDLIKGKL